MWKGGSSWGYGGGYSGGGKGGGDGKGGWEIDPEESRADNELFRATRRVSVRLRHGLIDQLNETGAEGKCANSVVLAPNESPEVMEQLDGVTNYMRGNFRQLPSEDKLAKLKRVQGFAEKELKLTQGTKVSFSGRPSSESAMKEMAEKQKQALETAMKATSDASTKAQENQNAMMLQMQKQRHESSMQQMSMMTKLVGGGGCTGAAGMITPRGAGSAGDPTAPVMPRPFAAGAGGLFAPSAEAEDFSTKYNRAAEVECVQMALTLGMTTAQLKDLAERDTRGSPPHKMAHKSPTGTTTGWLGGTPPPGGSPSGLPTPFVFGASPAGKADEKKTEVKSPITVPETGTTTKVPNDEEDDAELLGDGPDLQDPDVVKPIGDQIGTLPADFQPTWDDTLSASKSLGALRPRPDQGLVHRDPEKDPKLRTHVPEEIGSSLPRRYRQAS